MRGEISGREQHKKQDDNGGLSGAGARQAKYFVLLSPTKIYIESHPAAQQLSRSLFRKIFKPCEGLKPWGRPFCSHLVNSEDRSEKSVQSRPGQNLRCPEAAWSTTKNGSKETWEAEVNGRIDTDMKAARTAKASTRLWGSRKCRQVAQFNIKTLAGLPKTCRLSLFGKPARTKDPVSNPIGRRGRSCVKVERPVRWRRHYVSFVR